MMAEITRANTRDGTVWAGGMSEAIHKNNKDYSLPQLLERGNGDSRISQTSTFIVHLRLRHGALPHLNLFMQEP